MEHVKKTMRAHKGVKLAAILKMAKKTYKKGGAEEGAVVVPAAGRRKTRRGRGTRKTRKH